SALRRGFLAVHQARYGFTLPGPLEWVALRAELRGPQRSGRAEDDVAAPQMPGDGDDGDAVQTGPVAISTWSATLWLPAGWRAEELPTGDWLCTARHGLHQTGPGPGQSGLDGAVDDKSTMALDRENSGHQRATSLNLEVHRQRLAAIAEQMGVALKSAALSANIKERRDYSCAIFDGAGQMLVHAAHIPVHLGSTPASVAAAIAAGPMQRGDDWMLNDPFMGGTHLPDVTVVSPVFVGNELEPRWYVANRAHHADVGGITPGSMPAPIDADGRPRPLTIDDEGFRVGPTRITPALREAFANASRMPVERLGDLRAQEAANHVGARLLLDLAGGAADASARVTDSDATDLSTGQLEASLLDYAERRMRAVLRSLPDGSWRFVDALDDDGLTNASVPIPVSVSISGDSAVVDLREAPDASPGPLNAVRAIAVSAVFYVFRALAGGMQPADDHATNLPANAGLMRPITVLTRPGSIVDAQAPSAVSSGNVETSQRLVDALMGALAPAAPEVIPAASCGSMSNLLFGGQLPDGDAFVHYETLAGGAGGGPMGPGADGVQCHMTNTRNTPVEALEHNFPVRVARYALRQTDQRAQHRGGEGIVRAIRFLSPVQVTVVSERRRLAPWGLSGGQSGAKGENWLVRADGSRVRVGGKVRLHLHAGDTIEVHTPGGGGWGT
ncbi:MAG: hydantoinase B/oxoprolinase family protein, partial [Myxococcales bacterium]|nr:hydantoinase B/oxoprolinase family protein [Myxococcales bacterium]